MNVAPIDWVILGTLFLGLLVLAIWINSQCKSVADYLVSGRKVRLWLGIGAGIAGEVGLVSIAAMCEQGYMRGFGFVLIGLIAMCITVPVFGIFGIGIERFRATKAMSVPQYVEMRYSRRLRLLTGMFNSLAGVLQMCIFPIVGASFLRVLMAAPEYASIAGQEIPTEWLIMGVLLGCAVLFTYFGGYITLTVTNFVQMIVIMVAVYWVLSYIVADLGLQNLWTTLEQERGNAAFYPFADGDSSYGWQWFAWMMAMTILLQFSYGPYLQKYASLDKPKTVSRSYLISTLFGNGRTYVIIGLGVCALVGLGTSPPQGLATSDQQWMAMATPYYLSQVTPPIVLGLLLAGLLFADISTTDQYLLSWSTSIVNDCVCPLLSRPLEPKTHIMAVRLTIVVLCILFFIVGVFYEPTLPIWEFMWLLANIIGGTGIAVLFGMYWKRASTVGAYGAVLVSLVLPLLDLALRWFYVAREWDDYPLKPQETGLYTYVLATITLIVLSLSSRQPTGYWDLGEEVRKMNAREASNQ